MQSYTKNSKSANDRNINTKIDSTQQTKALSSITNLIFFIDVEKKCEYAKLEDKIKTVGGTINLFLTDDVTHFITDKSKDPKILNGKDTPTDNKSTPTDLNAHKINSSRTRSRVDEMIHRARLETNLSQSRLLDVALLKNIRIWDYNYANIFLNKTIKKLRLYKNNKKKGVVNSVHLTEPFIKIEDISNKYRPYYQILKSKWPFINLFNCDLNNTKTSNQDVVNHNKVNVCFNETDNIVDRFGYCELCKCEYDKLSVHLETKQHFIFARDQKNYEDLDNLIYEKVQHKCFFEENLSKIKNKKKETNKSMTKLQYHDYFSRSVTENEKALCVQSKINRVTRQGVNIEHNTNGCKRRKNEVTKSNKISSNVHVNLKSNLNYVSEVRKSDKDSESYTKDNSSLYYKVIKSQCDPEENFNNKINDKDITKPAIIVKFRKIRQSELSILNGEAENFMFPKTKSEIDKKENNEQKPNKRKYSSTHAPEEKSEEKIKNNSETKKRGSQITENKLKGGNKTDDYLHNFKNLNYSFETIPSTEPWYNVFRRQDTGKEHIFEFFGGTGYRKLPYEMGHIPLTQGKLYKNFCMLCKNKVETNISEKFDENQGGIRIKLENENANVKEKYANNQKNSASCKYHTNNNIQNNLEPHLDLQQQSQEITLQQATITKPFKKFYLMNLDMPRKSPREHASTLAMLSCLVKKSSSCQNSVNNDSKEPTPEPLLNIRANSTSLIENENDSKLECKEIQSRKETDNKLNKYLKRKSKSFYNERIQKMSSTALEKEIDYFLKKSYSDCLDFNNPLSYRFSNSIEHNESDSDGGEKEKFLSDVNFNDILDRSMKEELSYNRPLLLSDGLRIGLNQKKRPINKTGWPCKKKLLTRRQKGCLTGFHHHKGVLVKKSSPWSIISNIPANEETINQDFNDALDSNTTFNNIPSVTSDLVNENCSNKLEKSDRKETPRSKSDVQETFLCYNSNEQSALLTAASVPSSVLPINETKSRTHIKSPTIATTAKVNSNSISPPSSRVLRKPRGRWYRER
ncbi:protein chiffon-like [Condylostylus longicornis]|uniref:protein chiffon-like n=1 Tax=Condylostylus longicornis TaxID=2530218 RepID=UPI00244DD9AD|nr:protein chiffon-like [Condylostylus longicornis]